VQTKRILYAVIVVPYQLLVLITLPSPLPWYEPVSTSTYGHNELQKVLGSSFSSTPVEATTNILESLV